MGGIWDGTLCAVWCRCSAAIPRLGPRVFRRAGPSPALSAPVDVGAHCRGSLPKAPMRGAPAHGGTRRDGSAGPTRAEIAPPGSGVDPALVVDQMAAHVVDGSRASPTRTTHGCVRHRPATPQSERSRSAAAPRPSLGPGRACSRSSLARWGASAPSWSRSSEPCCCSSCCTSSDPEPGGTSVARHAHPRPAPSRARSASA